MKIPHGLRWWTSLNFMVLLILIQRRNYVGLPGRLPGSWIIACIVSSLRKLYITRFNLIITVAGHKTNFEVRTLPQAAEHFIKKIIPEEVRKDLDVYIEIVDGFKDCPNGSVYGFSSPDFGDDEEHDDPKHFYNACIVTGKQIGRAHV